MPTSAKEMTSVMLTLILLCTIAAVMVCASAASAEDEMRASFFDWTLDEANTTTGRDGWRQRMEKLQAEGYNSIILMGHHFRWSLVDKWPETVEALAALTDTAHSLGMKIYEHHSAALCSANATDQPARDGQRVWDLFEIKADTGQPINYMYDAYWLCPNNPTYRAMYLDYVRDIFTRARFDGFMCDDVEMLPDASVCACRFCAERFERLTGAKLPSWDDKSFWFNQDNPLWRQWMRARETSVADFYRDVNALLQKLAPGTPMFICQADPTGSLVTTSWALANDVFDSAVGIRFWEDYRSESPDYRAVWRRAILNLTYLDSIAGQRKPVLDLFYTATEPQTRMRWACDRVTGAWTSTVESCPRGAYMKQFRQGPPGPAVANVALVHSAASRDYRLSNGHTECFHEWGEALVENKASFAVLTEDQLEQPTVLAKYNLIILPGVCCLSASAAKSLAEASRLGTHVAFTADTGIFDETGAPREAASAMTGLANGREIPRAPEGWNDIRQLIIWADALPVAQVRGSSVGFCRLFDAGDGRYQLRIMEYDPTPNKPWRIALPGRPIASAKLRGFDGQTLNLTISGGTALVPAATVTGYCEVDIVIAR